MHTDTTPPNRWQLDGKHAIVWNVKADTRLPHEDHLEMSGRHVSLIVRYKLDNDRHLSLEREVIWPTLRLKKEDVRGYLIRKYGAETEARLHIDGKAFSPGPVAKVRFDGILTFISEPQDGIVVSRSLFPATTDTQIVEQWTVKNVGKQPVQMEVVPLKQQESVQGIYGTYRVEATAEERPVTLKPGRIGYTFRVTIGAYREGEAANKIWNEYAKRFSQCATLYKSLVLETPDPTLNTAFNFAKLRAAESLFETKMGLVHSPGGGRYYGGVWANDQAEYAGPFFPFLGYKPANDASLNAYRIFAKAMTPEYHYIPSSFEVEGDVAWSGARDRGDAAMVAYGASRYALALGNKKTAEELWKPITWCLEYCHRKTNADGVVESNSDELEGRFSTGNANLSTSTLCYGALRSAANLGRALNKPQEAEEYDRRADALAKAISSYFGANVEGYDTYRYYDGNTVLRAWICLPLTMGLLDRKAGTVQALFSPRLWTADGLATEAGDKVFWDRSTLYALRGVFAAGETETALRYLTAYTQRRLLGDHVPYPVEAYPEGGQAHLSAESALYCRVITEGLFGITPIGLKSFQCVPRLPKAWPVMALRDVRLFGKRFDIEVSRKVDEIGLKVVQAGQTIYTDSHKEGQAFVISF